MSFLHRLIRVALVVVAIDACVWRICAESSRYLNPAEYEGSIRVACVGDSITYGANIVGRETNCYPAVLGRCLGGKFDVRNFGVNAATLLNKGDKPYTSVEEFKQATDFAPHVVIIKLGTNDSKPHNWAHKDEFAADLRALIAHFAALPTRPRIWLCRPVPVYEDRWGINEATVYTEIIPLILQVAQEKNLPVIDLHTGLTNHRQYFPDGIHPDHVAAASMARIVCAALLGPG